VPPGEAQRESAQERSRGTVLVEALTGLRDPTCARASYEQLWCCLRDIGRGLGPHCDDDALQETLIRVVKRFETGAFCPENDAVLVAYLRTSLRNEVTTRVRKSRARCHAASPLRDLEGGSSQPSAASSVQGPASALDVDALLGAEDMHHLFEQAAAHASMRRPPGEREEYRAAVDGLLQLHLGETTMQRLVAAELAFAGGEGDRARVRNRIYKRHERLREDLLCAAEAFRDEGIWSDEDLIAFRHFVGNSLRGTRSGAT
jgi:DNA-directed RNA polymerase specialized sigma24 family protein